ncbi:MAG: hypothetical protein ACRDP3_00650 [Streptomyces sp.]|uniref:hypothetical protein n=1 Tax=Streptomyces sp. TaxID=1931 RepID=UPI003D6BB3D6
MEFTSLAQTAGTTLVALMATDAWERTREGITQLWRRIQPHRAEAVAAELEISREDIVAARTTDDQETLSELSSQWQGRFRRLLVARPEAAEELHRLLDELGPPATAAGPAITQQGTASGQARIYQAGRDQHITER